MPGRSRTRSGPEASGTPGLIVHLAILLLLKFAVLALIWHQLFMPYRVQVDARAMEQRLASPSAPGAADDRSHAR